MKRRQVILILIFGFNIAIGQAVISGEWRSNLDNNKLWLNSDDTFLYKWNYDMASSWSQGTWRVNGDTKHLIMIAVYDTISYYDFGRQTHIDSLFLSPDLIPNRTTVEESYSAVLSSGGQNRVQCPSQLYHKRGKLYGVDESRGVITNKIYRTVNGKRSKYYYIKT